MSNQTKVTDFFTAQKKNLRSAKKLAEPTAKSLAIESSYSSAVEEVVITNKTPKRKKVTTNDQTLKSSKRKKTPKCKFEDINSYELEDKPEENTVTDKSAKSGKSNKQLNAKEVKEKLVDCNNLLKLKQQLSKINDCAAKVKQFKEIKVRTPTKKPIRTPTKNRSPSKFSPIRPILSNTPITPIIPPLKSPIRVTPDKNSDCAQTFRRRLFDVFEEESPKKIEKKTTRAYENFSYLLDKPEENKSLVLPLKYKLLADMFKAMDIVVSMHYKRQEVCTFEKVKDSVERMTSRKFDVKRLAQIQTVFSGAFKLKYELFSTILSNRKPTFQLVISPIYNSNIDIRLNSSHLLERYQTFVDRLLEIAKRHHKNYLNNLGIVINDNELFRWHPKFRLDSVPDIEPNDNALPPEPKFGEKSAETFLENSRQRLGIESTTTTETKTSETNDNNNQKLDNNSNDSNKKITKGLLKGISVDLLNKIRAKEAANLAQEMTRKPEVETELRILSSLPQFVRIIHSYLIGSNKVAVPYDELIDKVISSFNVSLSIVRAREHVDYLCRLFPNWIYLLEVKRGNYLKINKRTNIATLDQKISDKVSQLKKCR